MKRLLPYVFLLALPVFAPAEEKWVELFNGKDLQGWTQKGGAAKYAVEGDAIVGTTVPDTTNSFLCTEREYGNFILEFEFKVDEGLNSGVQIRSHVSEGESTETWDGKALKFAARRVHGLQYEIDTTKRAWTAGLYGEGGAGWRHDLKDKPAAREAFKHSEWNKARIEARGQNIKTWLNGVPAADLILDAPPKGFLALQVHGIGKRTDVMQVRFRGLRLRELP